MAIVKSHIWVLPLLPARGRGGKTFETNKNQTRHKTDSVRGGGGGVKKVSSSCLSLSPPPSSRFLSFNPFRPLSNHRSLSSQSASRASSVGGGGVFRRQKRNRGN